MCYVCFTLNHTYNVTIKNVPFNASTGSTYDVSPLLRFHFWKPIYYNADDDSFSSNTPEEKVRFVGVSINIGHGITFKELNTSTNKVISIFNVRFADDKNINLRAEPLYLPEVVKSLQNDAHAPDDRSSTESTTSASRKGIPILGPSDLVGRTFLLDKKRGQRLRARIVQAIDNHEGDLVQESSNMRFICTMKDGTIEEIFTCNELIDHANNSSEDDFVERRFKRI